MSGNKALLDSNVIIDASKGIVSIQDIDNSVKLIEPKKQ